MNRKQRTGVKTQGFTLIEILVVIGIIAVLAAVVLIAINPARQFQQARDSQRTSNVNAILNAIGQYVADNKGVMPAGIPDAGDPAEPISDTLCDDLVATYLPALPTDPSSSYEGAAIANDDCGDLDANESGYMVEHDADGRITISAPDAEIDENKPIEVTR